MPVFVIRGGRLVEKSNAPQSTHGHAMSDIRPFVTQDGVEITSRSQLRAFEQATGTRQCGNDWTGPSKLSWDSRKHQRVV